MLITAIDKVSPAYITALLRAHDIISESEKVAKLRIDKRNDRAHSHTATLSVQYESYKTQRHAPDYLFVKISKPTANGEVGASEVRFYMDVAPRIRQAMSRETLPMPFGYDGVYDETKAQYHLVLESLQKYEASNTPEPPTQRHRNQLIDGLARLHGYWWEHDDLSEYGDLPTEDTLDAETTRASEQFQRLKSFARATPYMDMLQDIAEQIPAQRRKRLLAGSGLTILHGDLQPSNILYSHAGTRLVDWRYWHIGTATDDLAFLIGGFWSDALRKFHERDLLRRYYDGLLKAGVSGYSWDDCWLDYRLSLGQIVRDHLLRWSQDYHMRGEWNPAEHALNVLGEHDGRALYG